MKLPNVTRPTRLRGDVGPGKASSSRSNVIPLPEHLQPVETTGALLIALPGTLPDVLPSELPPRLSESDVLRLAARIDTGDPSFTYLSWPDGCRSAWMTFGCGVTRAAGISGYQRSRDMLEQAIAHLQAMPVEGAA